MKKILGIIVAILVCLAFLAPLVRGTPRLLHGSNVVGQSESTSEDYYAKTVPLIYALMGDLYYQGKDAKQDMDAATKYYAEASRMGHARAQSMFDRLNAEDTPVAEPDVIDNTQDKRALGEAYLAFDKGFRANGASIADSQDRFLDIIAPAFESTREMMVFQGKVLGDAIDVADATTTAPAAE